MFQVIFWDESTIAVLDDRVKTVLRWFGEKFLPECLKKTVDSHSKLWYGGPCLFMELVHYPLPKEPRTK